MLMARFSKSFSLIKGFVTWMTHSGLPACAGSYLGGESVKKFGMISDVRLWQLGEYKSRETQLPSLINPDWIVGHLGMTTVSIGKDRTKVWATIDLKVIDTDT
ncbi:hypothetical protein EV702DRAFT_1202903 [Suillus placidus]|uniref:Uncharacterized protein n=1 Tax=Suillus placidus TaxID=48579 RepID=A0A9P7CWY6_9AGAM|nr:hypothetical protein EV702DRAFT_1202903 [Suillus placidus]